MRGLAMDRPTAVDAMPGHSSTGGHNKMTGITKGGDRYLRAMVDHGARSAVSHVQDKQDSVSGLFPVIAIGRDHILSESSVTTRQLYDIPLTAF